MNDKDLQRFHHQHCRFKLKSGKEVFGVIWQDEGINPDEVHFASVRDHEAYVSNNGSVGSMQLMKTREIVYAENL